MTSTFRSMRLLILGAVVLALATATGGCSWFRHKADYTKSGESRPLEVPPDLDLPDTAGATAMPTPMAAGPSSGTDGHLTEAASIAYPKIGEILLASTASLSTAAPKHSAATT